VVRPVPPESEGMVEMWDRNDVPGAAGQRTRLKRVEVVGEVDDDYLRDFIR